MFVRGMNTNKNIVFEYSNIVFYMSFERKYTKRVYFPNFITIQYCKSCESALKIPYFNVYFININMRFLLVIRTSHFSWHEISLCFLMVICFDTIEEDIVNLTLAYFHVFSKTKCYCMSIRIKVFSFRS